MNEFNPTFKPEPKPTPETAEFWAGCAAGELRLQHCQDCQHVQFYPRKLCSNCFSERVMWQTASGHGRILSWSTVGMASAPGFEAELPFISILVKLDEGPTMLSVLRNCSPEQVDFDLAVEAIFERRSETIYIPYFQPR